MKNIEMEKNKKLTKNSPFCFLAVAGGTGWCGGTTTGRGTIGGAELPAGGGGGCTGRNDWFGGWLGG